MNGKFKDKVFWFGTYVITLVVGYVFAVTFIPVEEAGIKYADIAVPFLLGSGFGLIVGFYYQSTQASQDKTKTITDQNAQVSELEKTLFVNKDCELKKKK